MVEITPQLDVKSKKPLYIQLYEYIKRKIISGTILPETRLPPIRGLSLHLNISRNTVELAYQQLVSEGYVQSRPRSGLYVIAFDKELPSFYSNQQLTFDIKQTNQQFIDYDFRYGNVDLEHFPFSVWKKFTNKCLSPDQQELFSYGDPKGEPGLRVEIAKYLHYSRGVNCSPEQIIVGAGIQQLLSLLAQLIKVTDNSFAMENPGYDGVRMVFRNHGFIINSIPLEKDGLDVQDLYKNNAKLVYITPSHQFPCGMVMPFLKRMQLLQWAKEEDSFIIEDDYDSEFRYIGKPIPSLQGIDTNDRVIYLGTFSKSLLPSLRIGYMVLPSILLKRYENNFQLYDQTVSRIHQTTLQWFMENGHWEKHLRKMRIVYQKKQHTLISTIQNFMKGKVRIIGKGAGLHILLEVYQGKSEGHLIKRAKKFGVKVYPVSKHWENPNQMKTAMVQLGFGGLTNDQITEGIKSLQRAWFEEDDNK
ncbi:PLP-dependent aminotransferase family protein [Alteribacillus sp. HJP-4]|uniref:MocR-like pyridoxine biosynthesis transcription factor PdxR n=1 Tax=Alteribacillus sp. HJP-4 TaxID=2775394 RepID=UPI0035CD20C8